MQADGDGPLFADAAEMVIAAAAILARGSGKRRAQMVLELAGRVPPEKKLRARIH